jgi:hypothetical protein
MFFVESTGQFWNEDGSWWNHPDDATSYDTQAAARAALSSIDPAEDDACIVFVVTALGEEEFSVQLKVVATERECAFHAGAVPVTSKVEALIGGFLMGMSVSEDDSLSACASCADLVSGMITILTGRKAKRR